MKKILIVNPTNHLGRHLTEYFNIFCSNTVVETMGFNTIPQFAKKYHHWYRNLEESFALSDEYDVVIYNEDISFLNLNIDKTIFTPSVQQKSVMEKILHFNVMLLFQDLHNIKYKNFIYISDRGPYESDNYYALTKKIAEETVAYHCHKRKIPFTIFNVFGLIGYKNFFPDFTDNLGFINQKLESFVNKQEYTIYRSATNTKDRTEAKDYVHVLEACEAIYKGYLHPTGHVEHLCYNDLTTEKELVELFADSNKMPRYTINYKINWKSKMPTRHYETSLLLERKYTKHDWVRIRQPYNPLKAIDFDKLKG
jgi:hypothetical protein